MSKMVGQDMLTGMGFIGTKPGMYRMTPPYTYGEAEGTAISVASKGGQFKGMRVMGRTEQETTTGAQLLDISKLEIGKAWNNSNNTARAVIPVSCSPNTTYTVSVSGGSFDSMHWVEKESEESTTSLINTQMSSFPFTRITTGTTGVIFLQFNKTGISISDFDGVEIMLNSGSVAMPWEPYTCGMPSPNPDYPQELVSVGDGGSVEVDVCGGNLFDYETIKESGWQGKTVKTETGITIYAISGWHLCLFDTSKFAGQEMTVTCKWKVNIDESTDADDTSSLFSIVSVTSISYPKDNQKFKLVRNKVSTEYETVSVTFTADIFTGFFVRLSKENIGLKRVYSIQDIQFSTGENRKYEKPIPAQILSIQTTNGLPGIPVTDETLANYTDADGQMWCCDEVDFDRGVYVQRIYRDVLDGSKLYVKSSSSNENGTPFACPTTQQVKGYNKGALSLCNNRTFYIGGIPDIKDYEFCVFGAAKSYVGFCSATATTVDEFKAEMDANPAIILCALETPIETPLTDEEIAAYRALHTNKPVTTITNSDNAHMIIKFKKER